MLYFIFKKRKKKIKISMVLVVVCSVAFYVVFLLSAKHGWFSKMH